MGDTMEDNLKNTLEQVEPTNPEQESETRDFMFRWRLTQAEKKQLEEWQEEFHLKSISDAARFRVGFKLRGEK
jgi:hypothetical protein